MYIYIYIYRERERYMYIYIYICMYVYIYIYMFICKRGGECLTPPICRDTEDVFKLEHHRRLRNPLMMRKRGHIIYTVYSSLGSP